MLGPGLGGGVALASWVTANSKQLMLDMVSPSPLGSKLGGKSTLRGPGKQSVTKHPLCAKHLLSPLASAPSRFIFSNNREVGAGIIPIYRHRR